MDIYIKGHKDMTVASELVPVESSPVYNEHAGIAHSYTAYGGYLGYAYFDSYSYHLCVGQTAYVGYTHIPIKLSYSKSHLSYVEQSVPIEYDVYLYQLDEVKPSQPSARSVEGVESYSSNVDGGDDKVGDENVDPKPELPDPEPYVPQYSLVSDIEKRQTSALVYTPIVRDEEISYEYNSYASYSYSYSYLASYSYFHHDWQSYSYSYSYIAYAYNSYITATTVTEWVNPLTSNSLQSPSEFTPYQYINPDVAVTAGARE